MNNVAKSAEELRWQGRDDAYTLSRAEAIKADKDRYANAQKEARSMLAEREEELNGLRKVSGRKTKQTPIDTKGTKVTKETSNPWGRDPFSIQLNIGK